MNVSKAMADSATNQKAAAAEADNTIPISLGKPSLRRRLEAYYSLINPDSIQDPVTWRSTFAQIYDKYGGTYDGERKLAAKLSKKYGSKVRLLLAEASADNSNKASAVAKLVNNDHQQRKEEWFALRQPEENSGIVDFTSDCFDPVAALKSSSEYGVLQTNPWIPSCPVLNFVDQFRSYLPTNDPLHRALILSNNSKKKAAAESKEQQQPTTTTVRKLGPFAAIAEQHKTGPFSMLHKLLENKRQRVRILIRYVNGIRGTVTGYLVAYDKHYNMILRDVDEVYCPRNVRIDTGDFVTGEAPVPSNSEVELGRRTQALMQTKQQKLNRDSSNSATATYGWQVRQRHMKQILVRGDNVVMVYKAESERSAWPRSSKSPAKSVHGRKAVVVPPEERVGTPGSLIYSLQRQQHQQQQRRRPSPSQRYDYRSSTTK